MKFVRFLIVLLVAGGVATAAWYMNRLETDGMIYPGYVEGEYIELSVPVSGTLASLNIMRGQRVEAGAALFSLDKTTAMADVAQAEAGVERTRAELADRKKGARAEELEVRRAEMREAEATLLNAEQELKRQRDLVGSTAFVQAKLDSAKAAYGQARARLAALQQAFDVANLPARQDQLEAAGQVVREAEATLAKANRRVAELAPVAPVGAVVQDTYFLPGAWVPANKPVVTLLPDDKRKLRFFVPEAEIARIKLGQPMAFTCDGCEVGLRASVIYIAPEAEYTPPVIYSADSREKLVFLIEALPMDGVILPVGLPVEVERVQ
ncbi:HlyD family secretion protein [Kordiimonas aestuarii]|uniref:HlyD family secretion protein n=1 Tax=Kordiimonas aestuarii TaxID=1005925 RepID=UPI0021CE048E|nr:HlyD family efflux transporter periplasmic adaptor subunit [Kordiimonas aestuarii]